MVTKLKEALNGIEMNFWDFLRNQIKLIVIITASFAIGIGSGWYIKHRQNSFWDMKVSQEKQQKMIDEIKIQTIETQMKMIKLQLIFKEYTDQMEEAFKQKPVYDEIEMEEK